MVGTAQHTYVHTFEAAAAAPAPTSACSKTRERANEQTERSELNGN